MKRFLFACLPGCLSIFASAQLNMTLLDQIDYTQNTNDIWGWVDPDDSTEYALAGTVTGVSVVSLADPENIVEVAFLAGANSTWRDIKTWGNYAYVTNEKSNGLMVIDLTDAPNNITATDWTPSAPGMAFSTAHNLYIDEFGYCYIAGANVNSGGMVILDVFTTPGTPQFVAAAPAVYAHDVYVRENKMYASEIYLGRLAIYDVSNKNSIPLLATQQTPFNFTHNAWLNDAGAVVFTTDEKANAPVAAYDIANLNNIVELDQFKPVATLNANVIPHNVHVWDDWLIISYYTDGGIIVDASKPDNLIEVGNWDTFLGGNGGYSGAWGAYPFLPSGLVLLTDIGNGLYICGATYVRACWLEGKVTSSATGLPIFGADIHIESSQANVGTTNTAGNYKTGQATPGVFDVTFSAVGFNSKTVQATLENGVLTILDVQLDPISSFSVAGQTVKMVDGTPVAGAQVFLQGDQTEYTAVTDGNGNFAFPGVLGGNYTLYAGAWGYLHEVVENFVVGQNTTPIVVSLTKGYQDDFILNLGWTETHTASTGWWVRGLPVGTDYNGQEANTGADVTGDIGDQCFVTGNGGGGAGDDDVDNGVVTLYSPVMNLSNYNEPVLKYRTWFYNAGGSGQPNDALQVRITNGTGEVILETITQSQSQWRPESELNLSGLIALTSNMQVIFETSDLPTSGHLVEAAVDAFFVEDISPYPPFSASTTEGCSPFTVNFSDPSDSTAIWVWTFEGGNPATSIEQNPSVTFDTPGSFDVNLSVVTNDGITYTISRPNFITVNAEPIANFDYIVAGAVVNFTNLSTNGGNYSWSFGDNVVASGQNPSHTYTQTGIFTVTLTATNGCGASSFSQDVLILDVPPTANFQASTIAGCAPMTVQFTDLSTGGPDTWAWEFPGGSPSASSGQNPSVVYTVPGTYSVQLTVSNGAGDSQVIQSQFIEVGVGPVALFDFDVNANVITFSNTSTDATSYEWAFGDGTTSMEVSPVHAYPGPGLYVVTLTASSDCGFAAFTQTMNIQVNAAADLDETSYTLTAAPNPFNQQVLVKYELQGNFNNANLLVFNILGKQVSSVKNNATGGTVQLGDAISESGVYFLRLVVDGKVSEALRLVKI